MVIILRNEIHNFKNFYEVSWQFMNFFNEYILICNKKKWWTNIMHYGGLILFQRKKSEFTLEVLLKTLVDLFTKLSELFTRSDLFTIMGDLITTPFDLLTLLVGHKLSNQLGVGGVPEPHPAVPSSRNQVGPTPCWVPLPGVQENQLSNGQSKLIL